MLQPLINLFVVLDVELELVAQEVVFGLDWLLVDLQGTWQGTEGKELGATSYL